MPRPSRARVVRLLGTAAVAAVSACGLVRGPQPEPRGTRLRIPPLAGLDLLVPVPEANPLTVEAVTLGERLFFDRGVSADGTVRCASCHRPDRAFSDTARLSRGVYGRVGQRNAPTLLNRAYGRAFFWDGRAGTLEEQALHPIRDSIEMGQSLPRLVAYLRGDRAYRSDFRRAFGGGIDSSGIARALASYVRTLRSGDAPVDRWRDGDTAALSPAARRGLGLFTGRANCVACHVPPTFTDERFHNTGVSARSARDAVARDSGRALVTRRPEDVGAFKTPTLRSAACSAPYMHDGSQPTLDSVVAFYDDGGQPNPNLDPEIAPLRLTPSQRRDLVVFIEALTGATGCGSPVP